MFYKHFFCFAVFTSIWGVFCLSRDVGFLTVFESVVVYWCSCPFLKRCYFCTHSRRFWIFAGTCISYASTLSVFPTNQSILSNYHFLTDYPATLNFFSMPESTKTWISWHWLTYPLQIMTINNHSLNHYFKRCQSKSLFSVPTTNYDHYTLLRVCVSVPGRSATVPNTSKGA